MLKNQTKYKYGGGVSMFRENVLKIVIEQQWTTEDLDKLIRFLEDERDCHGLVSSSTLGWLNRCIERLKILKEDKNNE